MGKNDLPSLDTLFGGYEENNVDGNRLIMVDASLIDPHPDHHFKPFDEKRHRGLLDSIQDYGVMQPVILQPKVDGRYTMLAGYKRLYCNNLAGHQQILAIIKEDIPESVAKAMISHTNTRQSGLESLMISELAFALKIELESFVELRKQMKKNGILSGKIEVEGKVSEFGHLEKSRDALAKTYGMKPTEVQRLLQITDLISEFLELLDTKKLAIAAAVPLSRLDIDTQQIVYQFYCKGHTIDITKAEALRNAAREGVLTAERLSKIMTATVVVKPDRSRVVRLQPATIQRYFTHNESVEEIQSTIEKALSLYYSQKEQY